MSEPLRVARGELTADEIIAAVDDGQRVIIVMDVLGRSIELSTRKRDEEYVCDTPVKLLTYETPAGFRACLERYRLAGSADDHP